MVAACRAAPLRNLAADDRSTPPLGTPSLRLTEWTSCGGCAAKWGASVLAEMVGDLPGSASTRRCSSGWRRSTTRRSTASTTRRRWCRRPTSSRRSSTTRRTTGRSPPPTRAATSSRWAAASCWRSTSPRSPSTSRGARWRRSSTPRRTVVAEAGGTVAGGHTIRNPEPVFGLAVQGLVHPDRVFRKGGARPGDVVLLSKPLGTGLTLAGGDRRREGRRDRRDADASTARRRRLLQSLGVGRPRRHRRHRLRARRPRLGGRRAQRGAPRHRRRRARRLPGRASRRPSAACAPAATPATATTSPGTSTSTAVGRRRGAGARPADVRRAAGGRRPGRRRRARRPPGSGPSARSRPASRRWSCGDGCRVRRRAVGAGRLQEAGADARRSSGRCGTSATRSSSASTRSAAGRGPGR